MEADPRPLAAYRLLHHTVTLRVWQLLADQRPEWEGTEAGVPATLGELDDALLDLAEVIPTNLYAELRSVLARYGELADNGGLDRRRQQARQALWQRLRYLADRALPRGSLLMAWGRLGVAVGEVELRLHVDAEVEVADILNQILTAIKNLPGAVLQASGVLGKLAAVPEQKDAVGLLKLLQKALGLRPDLLEDDDSEAAIRHGAMVTVGGVNAAIVKALMVAPAVAVAPPVVEEEATAEEVRPGHLGLILIAERHEVRRVGYRQPVAFGGKMILWRLVEALWGRREAFCAKEELLKAVWDDVIIGDNAFWSAVHDVRKLLQPLDVAIPYTKGLGYRLEEPGLEGRGW